MAIHDLLLPFPLLFSATKGFNDVCGTKAYRASAEKAAAVDTECTESDKPWLQLSKHRPCQNYCMTVQQANNGFSSLNQSKAGCHHTCTRAVFSDTPTQKVAFSDPPTMWHFLIPSKTKFPIRDMLYSCHKTNGRDLNNAFKLI